MWVIPVHGARVNDLSGKHRVVASLIPLDAADTLALHL